MALLLQLIGQGGGVRGQWGVVTLRGLQEEFRASLEREEELEVLEDNMNIIIITIIKYIQ